MVQGDSHLDEAERLIEAALRLSREQRALSWELRAAISLARLRKRQGRPAEARPLLASVYEQFSEGFESSDLRNARSLLADMHAA